MVDQNSSMKKDVQFQKLLKDRIKKLVKDKDLTEYIVSQKQILSELDIDPIVGAAALNFLLQEQFYRAEEEKKFKAERSQACALQNMRMFWYRIEVGNEHRISVEILKQVLVEEAGVERRFIGRIDIRDQYTLIQLPNGMPTELLQHLKTVTINQKQLAIQRLKKRPGKKHRRKKPSASHKRVAAHLLAKS